MLRCASSRLRARMVFRAPLRTVAPASAPRCPVERAGVVGCTRLRACHNAANSVGHAAGGAARPVRLPLLARHEPLAAGALRAPARRLCARRGAAVPRSSRDPAGGETVRTLRASFRWAARSQPALQAPVNYQAVALTVGSAFAFGAGVYAFKGGDSVRSNAANAARRAAHA